MDQHRLLRCPRCASERVAGTSAREFCGYCGHEWQSGAHRVEPDPETPDGRDQHSGAGPWDRRTYDGLAADNVTVEWLRAWYVVPPTEAERAAARRHLDSLAEQ